MVYRDCSYNLFGFCAYVFAECSRMIYIFRSISGFPFRSTNILFQENPPSPIGFVIGKSFQLAAFSEAAFVTASSMARVHPSSGFYSGARFISLKVSSKHSCRVSEFLPLRGWGGASRSIRLLYRSPSKGVPNW